MPENLLDTLPEIFVSTTKLSAEVHPITDGKGRVSRIPTIFRNNYLAALKALSGNESTEPLPRVLGYAQKWTAAIDWGELEATHRILESCHAFLEPGIADETGVRSRLPG